MPAGSSITLPAGVFESEVIDLPTLRLSRLAFENDDVEEGRAPTGGVTKIKESSDRKSSFHTLSSLPKLKDDIEVPSALGRILPDIKKLPESDSSLEVSSKVKELNADSEVEVPVLLITTPNEAAGETAEDPGAPDVPLEPLVPEVPKVLPEVPDVPLLKPIKIQIVPFPED